MKGAPRILLIEPPFQRLFKSTYSLDRFPLALGYLSGVIRRDTDWRLRAYNADFCGQSEPVRVSFLASEGFASYLETLRNPSAAIWREVRSVIVRYAPDVVGISSKSQNFASARIVGRLAKEVNPSTIVVLGGPHASLVGAGALADCDDIDIAVCGEGEATIVELLRAIRSGAPLGGIDGIVFRRNGRIVQNPPRKLMDDLDALPFPHAAAGQVLDDFEKYPLPAFRSVFATRGCPYRCFFCGSSGIWTRRVRFRSPDNVVAEIRALQERGLRFVHFDDDTFGVNRRYLFELCDAINKHCRGLKFSCELHVNLVDDETISRMKSAGCFSIQLGIESGNDRVLQAIRKDITIRRALDACETIRRNGLEVVAFFMVGFPQETEDTLADTAAAMQRAACDVLVYSIFTPYPGTEAFEKCRQLGLVGDDYDASLYNHQSPANCFTSNIPPARFRELVSRIEKMVDRRNARARRRKIFSRVGFQRMREMGLRESLRKAVRVFFGR